MKKIRVIQALKKSRNAAYWFAVIIALALTTLSAVLYAGATRRMTLTFALLAPFLVNAYLLAVLGAAALLLRVLVPRSAWDCERSYFKIREKERGLYNRLKVRAWKDRIPEMGKAGGFKKQKIESLEPAYLQKFLQETCYAEAMHFTAGAAGFTVLLFPRAEIFLIALPLAIVNFALHALPCIVQRFTRCRLYRVYVVKSRAAAKAA